MGNAVLISIKPEWVRLIEQGKKTIEVRKSYPLRAGATPKCYIYEVAPVSKVVGEFICSSIEIYLSLFDDGDYYGTRIGEREFQKMCLTKKQFLNYAKSRSVFGWHIKDVIKYDKPKELSEFGLKRPPQSWCYVEDKENAEN